jgi:hypothetical protein
MVGYSASASLMPEDAHSEGSHKPEGWGEVLRSRPFPTAYSFSSGRRT